MSQIQEDNQNYLSNDSSDEIEFKPLLEILKRNKIIISKFILISLSISGVFFSFTKPKFSGQFEIVLKMNSRLENIGSRIENPAIRNYFNMGRQKNRIKTEVEILKSPSVLMPVFLYAKELKSKSSPKVNKLNYREWQKKHFSINLKKGTSVLDIKYTGENKKNILNILNKISAAYQEYSKKDRVTNIQKGIIYIDDQINLYKNKSLASLKEAQEFATKEDLLFQPSIGLKKTDSKNNLLLESSVGIPASIESVRVQASNELRNIEEQINQIKNLKNKEQIILIGRNYRDLEENILYKELYILDQKIAINKTYYLDTDIKIKTLQKQRENIINTLYDLTLNNLEAKRNIFSTRKKAYTRSKDVLIKYRELMNQSLRDQATLDKLESQGRFLALEQARNEAPWELITKPNIKEKPISPGIKSFLLMGLIIGLTSGTGYAFFKEKREDIIYTKKEIFNLLKNASIVDLEGFKNYQLEEDNIFKLIKVIEKNEIDKIGFLPIGSFDKNNLKDIQDSLYFLNKNSEIKLISKISEYDTFEKCILIVKLGLTTKSEILVKKENLEMLKKEIIAFIC